jgi:molybdopterin converting factor small subunit
MRSSAKRAGTGFSPIPDAPIFDLRLARFAISVSAECKSMKKVSVFLYGTLRVIRSDLSDRQLVQTRANSLEELLDEMNIPKDQAAIVFVNEKRARFESEIRDGNNIKIFPMLGGG